MKIQKLLILVAFISISNLSNAQLYKSALGIRLGPSNGITFKSFVNKNAAIEAIATFRYQGIGLTGLYEIHGRAFNSRDFNWFIGGGGHVFVWGNDRPKFLDREQSLVLGLDGILGLEAKLRGIPLAVSLDWKPTINIVNYSGFWGDEIALSLRYTW